MMSDSTASRPQTACYVGCNESLRAVLQEIWPGSMTRWLFFATGGEAAGTLLTAPPGILVCDLLLPDMSGRDVACMLKEENVYSQIPIVLSLSPEEMQREWNWEEAMVDDFFIFPASSEAVRTRLDLAYSRASRTLDANPLTRLPGNTSILRRIQSLIDQHQDFALGYCDLDNFKPFNDKYGFSRGDEVIMMAARIILNSVHNLGLPFSFVGHVGGDDYVFIVPINVAETVCRTIIAAFDGIIPSFYDAEDRQRECIVSIDRQNNVCSFPLMGVSIAVVLNRNGSVQHYGEASSIAMSLKKQAKKSACSSYVMDRRGGEGDGVR